MPLAFISLGSNIGDRLKNIENALSGISTQCRILANSSIYESEPWGVKDQPKFLNAVIKVETRLEPLELLDFLLNIEARLGRARKKEIRFGPRAIDLDILVYDGLEIQSERLAIPHPRMKERAFVLIPLYEIAGDKRIKAALDRIGEKEKKGVRKIV